MASRLLTTPPPTPSFATGFQRRTLTVRTGLATGLRASIKFFEASPWLSFGAVSIVYVLATLRQSNIRMLWHDEIFTFHISQAPTISELFSEVRSIDLNPPLSYLLTRLSFRLFGVNTLACRLPEMVAFLAAMLFLFLFLRARLGTLYSCLAASLLFASPAGELATEARPYALVLCFVCLSLLAWQQARQRKASAIPMLLLGVFGMLLSHIFAALAWGVFAVVELIYLWRSRDRSYRYLAVWCIPLVSAILYAPMVHSHGASMFPSAFQPNFGTMTFFYSNQLQLATIVGLLSALVFFPSVRSRELTPIDTLLDSSEWLSIIGLTIAPCLLIGFLILRKAAFFPRYGVIATLGIVTTAAVLTAWWNRLDKNAAAFAILAAFLVSGVAADAGRELLHHRLVSSQEPVPFPCDICRETAELDPSLPLVDASGLTFTEMNQYADVATLSRLYYLTDPSGAEKYAHASIFEGEAVIARTFRFKGKVLPYATFIVEHPKFFVYGTYDYPEDWLLRKLQDDGATIRVLKPGFGSYKDRDLYEVTSNVQAVGNTQ